MRDIIVHEFMTLDGVIQAPGSPIEDTEGGFTYGGWTRPYWHDEIGKQFGQTFANGDAFLLGRKTWQTHGAAFDPMPAGDPFGDMMNGIKKYVVSTTLKDTSLWRNSALIGGNVVEEVRRLKAQPGKSILIDGSSVIIHTLAENDLIDEYMLHVYPISLGIGKRLFPQGKNLTLRLVESRAIPSGVVYLRYRRQDG